MVGYFNSKDAAFLQPPQLETNAYANDYGQAEAKIAHGLTIKGMPSVNIHTYTFAAGTNTLTLPKGICLILGAIAENEPIKVYDAGLYETGNTNEIDWLFE